MKNTFTIQELKTIIQTMEQTPEMVDTMTITLRPQEAAGRINRTNGEVTFTPTHFEPPRGLYGRD